MDALRSRTVNLTALARRVEKAHFPDLAATSETTGESLSVPVSCMKHVISFQTLHQQSILMMRLSQSQLFHLVRYIHNVFTMLALMFTTVPLLIAQIEYDIKQFEKRFNQLKQRCVENLQKRSVPVRKVVQTLTDLPADDIDEHKMFLERKLKDLYEAPDHDMLIGQLSLNMNYLSYHLLDFLANEFDLGEVKPEMELYKSDLKQFRMRTPLKLFCKTQKRFVEPPQDFQKVIAKFSWPSDGDVTLEDVEQFRERYACHYRLRNFAIMIFQVHPGSFIVTWVVPISIIRKLKENIPRGLFKGVIKLKVGGSCIYDESRVHSEPHVDKPEGTVHIESLQDLPEDIYERLISSKNFNVLVTGCSGARKSNSPLSKEPVRYVLQVKGTKIQRYILQKDGTIMNFYYSPYMQEDLSHVRKICPEIDLLIYRSNMKETIEPAENAALRNITSIFGTSIWKNASIALANFDDLPNPEKLKERKWTHLQEAFMGIGITSQVLANLKGRTYVTGSAGMGNDWSNQFWRDFAETHHRENRQGLPLWSLAKIATLAVIAGTVVGVTDGILAGIGAGVEKAIAGGLLTIGLVRAKNALSYTFSLYIVIDFPTTMGVKRASFYIPIHWL